ncbi:MAG TPA: flippase activity-associated protein Agl23 [Pyrinomonadaceae bacterium]
MSTTSTKSSRKQSRTKDVPAKTETSAPVESPGMSDRAWRLSALGILIAGAFLRLYNLSLVPLHHDEGVNGNFLVTLVREGKYIYNPENYHGPTLYFFSAVIPWIARFFGGKAFGDNYGLTTFNIRLVTAAFGVGTIWLALLLRKRIGTIGALSAAGLIAISPGAVYLSRYFIHESLFVFFTLGIVVAALKYYDTGRATYLVLASISAALMVATKETWIINGPVLLIALVTTNIYFRLRERLAGKQSEWSLGERLRQTIDRFGGPVPLTTVALVAFAVFIIVNVLFYSSFFTNYPKGVGDAMKTLNFWRHRTHEHAHPFLQYFEWLRQIESPLLLLGAIGAAIAVWRGDNRFAFFAAQWAFGLLIGYSLVEYKTPWIALNFIVPLAIVGGYALDHLYRRFGEPWVPLSMTAGAIALLVFGRLVKLKYGDAGSVRGLTWDFDFSQHWPVMIAIVLLSAYAGYILYSRTERQKHPVNFYVAAAIVLSVLGYQMYQINFVHYDDDQYPYVYAHTRREMLTMVDEIDRISKRLGTGPDTGIALVSPDYWPLPWYLRDYKKVGSYQQIVPTNEPMIIGSMAQEEQLKETYGDRYVLVSSKADDGSYALRPGVDLLLYVRKDVAR